MSGHFRALGEMYLASKQRCKSIIQLASCPDKQREQFGQCIFAFAFYEQMLVHEHLPNNQQRDAKAVLLSAPASKFWWALFSTEHGQLVQVSEPVNASCALQ